MKPTAPHRRDITAVVLAGGRGRRMGHAPKALLPLAGRPMIAHVLQRLSPQVAHVFINANDHQDRYGELGPELVQDEAAGYQGPLAGILAALKRCPTAYLLTVPCDAPFVPEDLARRLTQALTEAHAAVACVHDGRRLQPLFALIRRDCAADLEAFLQQGERRVALWLDRLQPALADYSDQPDAFQNINTPDELARAERRAAE